MFVVPAAAQTGKLAEVKVLGSTKFPSEQIAAASGLKIGDSITKEDIQAAANRLAELGPFTNVRYRFSSLGDSVNIEFSLADAPTYPVLFDNFTLFSDEELNRTIKDAVVLFDGTAPEQGTILDAMTEALQQFLAKHGISAAVERNYLAGPGDSGMIQRFEIKGVLGLKVKSVQFSDEFAAQSNKLTEPARDLIGKPFSRFAAEVFANEQVRPLYLSRGNLHVQFGIPEARFTGNPNQPLPDNVTVFLPIIPGPVYKWGGVTWTGNSVLIPQALVDLMGFAPDETANGMKVEAGWERVKKEYAKHGYLEAAIDATPELDNAAARVHYRARITEGIQYRMGQMVITGLSITAERLLVAAWRIPPGEVFDKSYYDDFFENQVKAKKIFGEHVVNFERVGDLLQTNPQKKTVDVLLDFH